MANWKVYLTAALFCLALVKASEEADRSEEEEGDNFSCEKRSDGRYASGPCRSRHYKCENFKREKLYCDGDLRYSPELDRCIGVSAIPACRHQLMQLRDVKFPCRGVRSGFYPHPSNKCDRYSFCTDDIHYTVLCDRNQVYDMAINRCANPEQVVGKCGFAEPLRFTCADKEDDYYRSPNDCAVHYRCENQTVTEFMSCPSLMAFDTNEKVCKPVTEVSECQPREDATIGEKFCETINKNGVFADPRSCHFAILCAFDDFSQQYKAFSFVCSDKNEPDFDPVTNNCVAPRPGCSLPKTAENPKEEEMM